jgi:hypothetical protein
MTSMLTGFKQVSMLATVAYPESIPAPRITYWR